MGPVLYVTIVEAGDLCLRDHELGTCGAVVVEVNFVGRPTGIATTARPSFPRPRWGEVLEVPVLSPGIALRLQLFDADLFQPALSAGRRFSFGYVDVPAAEVAASVNLDTRRPPSRWPLSGAPGGQGFLEFQISCRREEQADTSAFTARPPPWPQGACKGDFCGVLCLAFAAFPHRCLLEASVGYYAGTSWEAGGSRDSDGPQRLLVVERDPILRIHATMQDEGGVGGGNTSADQALLAAHGEAHLASIDGPWGRNSLLLDPSPCPLALLWRAARRRGGHWEGQHEQKLEPPQMHLRFFPAEFLRPDTFGGGLRVRIRLVHVPLAAAPLLLPLAVHVPRGCFGSCGITGGGDRDNSDVSFALTRTNDCAEICLPDPLRLVPFSAWRIVASPMLDRDTDAFSTAQGMRAPLADIATEAILGDPLAECWLDVLALRLSIGTDRTVTVPLGSHSCVLRVGLTSLNVREPYPVEGVPWPDSSEECDDALLRTRPFCEEETEYMGIVVHALAVHSPSVTKCMLWGGPQPGIMFERLPHSGARVFVAAQPNNHGRALINALLPEHGTSAIAEAVLGDGPLQLHWMFPTPNGDVLAGALVTCVRWLASECGSPVVPVSLRVMRVQIPQHLIACVAPVTFQLGAHHVFVWSGMEEDAQDEVILPVRNFDSGFGIFQVSSGPSSFKITYFAFEILAVLRALGTEESMISLPVLAQQETDGFATFVFLPICLRRIIDPIDCDISDIPGEAVSGALLLQSISLCGTLGCAAHRQGCLASRSHASHPLVDTLLEPSSALAMSIGDKTSFGEAHIQRVCGAAVAWTPLGSPAASLDMMPHIVGLPYACVPGCMSIALEIELQLSCAVCGAITSLHAVPGGPLLPHELRGWKSFDIRLNIHTLGTHGLCRDAVAYARCVLCTSPFLQEPNGLVSLSFAPLAPGGVGVAELLRSDLGSLGLVAQRRHGGHKTLRIALGGEPCQALLLNENEVDSGRQLFVQTTSDHDIMRFAMVEIQDLSGAKVLLAAVPLAALGSLGARGQPVCHPVLLGTGLGFALVASYEPRRLAANRLPPSSSPGIVKVTPRQDVSVAHTAKTQLVADIARVRRLVPTETAPVGRVPSGGWATRRAWSAELRSRGGPRVGVGAGCCQSHPFLERGSHLWVGSRSKVSAEGRYWSQELDRKLPASKSQPERDVGLEMPAGWNDAREAVEGQVYRTRFLSERRHIAHDLRENLTLSQVEARKLERRLSLVKHRLAVVERELLRPAIDDINIQMHGLASVRPDKGAAPVAIAAPEDHVASDIEGVQAAQVCLRCEASVGLAHRFCEDCLIGVHHELSALQDEVGDLLYKRAALRREFELQDAKSCEQESRRRDLDGKRVTLGPPLPIGCDPCGGVLEMLTHLRSLQQGAESQSDLEIEELKILSDREASAKELLVEAHRRLAQAKQRSGELTSQLDRVYRDAEDQILFDQRQQTRMKAS